MTTNLQQSPYLREQRQFPNEDVKSLSSQSDQAYIDVAQKVNDRTIGLYAVNSPIITGEKWYLKGQEGQQKKQQTLRQVYQFTRNGSIPHGIDFQNLTDFTKCQGSFTNGSNYFGVIYGSNTAIPAQVSFYIDPISIIVLSGVGAPTISRGIIILEWIAKY